MGWDDKRHLPDERRRVLKYLIESLQPKTGGLFNASSVEGGESVNLLHVRRLRKLAKPFSVTGLVKTSDDEHVSDKKKTAGGWAYVKAENLDDLLV